jgi:hypothetical protein
VKNSQGRTAKEFGLTTSIDIRGRKRKTAGSASRAAGRSCCCRRNYGFVPAELTAVEAWVGLLSDRLIGIVNLVLASSFS